MSGIIGLVNLDGAPIEPFLLQRLTNFMAYRGPDAQNMWREGAVGLGHALLRTTDVTDAINEAQAKQQPFTLDGQVWIVADARIDGRAALLEKLKIKEPFALAKITDVELILRAYLAWGEDCVQQLIGDFVFAIWDGRRQRLFCARDHFGVKPFFYAHIGNCFIFSNTLNCLRQHPAVSSRLNEQALGDFLLFDLNHNLETTTFADIQRLPAAHTLTISDGTIQRRRYWQLPVPTSLIRYKQPTDYIAHFQELMEQAVADRLRTKRVTIMFSGGLDSTTIAATALEVAAKRNQTLNLQAYTAVYDRIVPDHERYFAGLAADYLKISIQFHVGDDYKLYEGWERHELHTPEPYHEPLSLLSYEQFGQMARHSRVALYGQGGDEALKISTMIELLQGGMLPLEVGRDAVRTIWTHRLRPPLGTGIYRKIQARFNRAAADPTYPRWLNPRFAARLDLAARWHEITCATPALPLSLRPRAYQGLLSPQWSCLFEALDPGFSGIPIEVRLPFLDLRLLTYLLTLPPLPWFIQKELLRHAMRGKLPEEVLRRPKTPLAGDLFGVHAHQAPEIWQGLSTMPELEKYVNVETVLQIIKTPAYDSWEMLRPLTLGHWLQQQQLPVSTSVV